jgi:ribosomal protein S18 acetylase RimI-like enzyme
LKSTISLVSDKEELRCSGRSAFDHSRSPFLLTSRLLAAVHSKGKSEMLAAITDDDLPGIVSLMNRAYRGSGASAGWNSEAAYITGDRTTEILLQADLLAKPNASFLKWIDPISNGLSGCVWLERVDDYTWYLGSLATDPDLQNAGVGNALLASAEHRVRAQGGHHIRMTVVNVRDTLIAWYIRRGYHLTGETEPFPYGDDRFGTPMRDDLAFVILEKALD